MSKKSWPILSYYIKWVKTWTDSRPFEKIENGTLSKQAKFKKFVKRQKWECKRGKLKYYYMAKK